MLFPFFKLMENLMLLPFVKLMENLMFLGNLMLFSFVKLIERFMLFPFVKLMENLMLFPFVKLMENLMLFPFVKLMENIICSICKTNGKHGVWIVSITLFLEKMQGTARSAGQRLIWKTGVVGDRTYHQWIGILAPYPLHYSGSLKKKKKKTSKDLWQYD